MSSRRTTSLSDVMLTAREHESMRLSIERIRRLGIRDRRLTNLVDRMSVTLKKGARRAEKSAVSGERTPSGMVDRKENLMPVTGE